MCETIKISSACWSEFVIILVFIRRNKFHFLFQESNKSGKKSYMRYYVPYKPGDEFKHRTPEGNGTYSFKMDLSVQRQN